jgi:hypothetical protein
MVRAEDHKEPAEFGWLSPIWNAMRRPYACVCASARARITPGTTTSTTVVAMA